MGGRKESRLTHSEPSIAARRRACRASITARDRARASGVRFNARMRVVEIFACGSGPSPKHHPSRRAPQALLVIRLNPLSWLPYLSRQVEALSCLLQFDQAGGAMCLAWLWQTSPARPFLLSLEACVPIAELRFLTFTLAAETLSFRKIAD
jgi:hypothetical protein